jgi:hypothetical protein
MKARIAERIAARREQQRTDADPAIVRNNPATERHYSPEEIAKLWSVHATTVKRKFEDRPGVLKLGRANTSGSKRRYTILRIPESVLQEAHQEMAR